MQNFNYHSHTYRCGHADMDVTDEDYVKEYIQMGFKKIAFTDHCPEKNENDKRPKMRMKYSQKNEYLNSIKALKKKYKNQIEILTGYEIEYLPGEEENLKELKKETDKLILGQHFVYDNNNKLKTAGQMFDEEELEKYVDYIQKAAKLKLPDIIAHPDIFMRPRDKFGEVEEKITHEICKVAEKYNIPLEINLNNVFSKTYYEDRKLNNESIDVQRKKLSKVKYPCRDFWKIAKEYDIRVVYGLDTHHKGQILLWNNLITLANEILGEDIINSLNFIED